MATTFFTVANIGYEPFVVPYAISVLHHNDDAIIEICVEDPDRFRSRYDEGLAVISKHFRDRMVIRGGQFEGVKAGTMRFLEVPTVKSEFTYIGDVDILVLDRDVTAQHVGHMERTGLPYSNRLRPPSATKKPRLTGLHFARTDEHYPITLPPDWYLHRNGEELLYQLTLAKGMALPDAKDTFRPSHGIHMSVKRSPTRAPGGPPWQLGEHHIDPYLALWEHPSWQEAARHFHPAYRAMLLVLEAAVQAMNPERLIYRRQEALALWSTLTTGEIDPLAAPPDPAMSNGENLDLSNTQDRESDTKQLFFQADARLEEVENRLSKLIVNLSSMKKSKAEQEIVKLVQRDVVQVRAEINHHYAPFVQDQDTRTELLADSEVLARVDA